MSAMTSTRHKTIILSDIHLGSINSKAKEATKFLEENHAETLILNGDIIDAWAMKRGAKWNKGHTQFFREVLKHTYKYNTRVIYIRGNHDDFLDTVVPFSFGAIEIAKEHILESGNKRFYVIHGDIFDLITTKLKWASKLGDVGYTALLWANRKYNDRRARKGLPYYSLSKVVKHKVKMAVNYVSDFEEQLSLVAKNEKCDGVICGHIHQPAIDEYHGITYMNSGDWVENCTALVEDFDNNWRIDYFYD